MRCLASPHFPGGAAMPSIRELIAAIRRLRAVESLRSAHGCSAWPLHQESEAKLDIAFIEVKRRQSLEEPRDPSYSSPLSSRSPFTTSRSVMQWRCVAPLMAALVFGIVACGDITSPKAALPTFRDSAAVYALNGAPSGAPTAFYAYAEQVVHADPSFRFDVAFDIDASGQALLLPVRTVANGLASSHAVGLQTVA